MGLADDVLPTIKVVWMLHLKSEDEALSGAKAERRSTC